MDTKTWYQSLRKGIRKVDRELELDLTDEEKELPLQHISQIIAAIAGGLGEKGEIAESIKQIEGLLGGEAQPEDSLVTRVDVCSEILSEYLLEKGMLKDVADLIGDALLGSDAELRKKFETLQFQLTKVDPSLMKSLYQEAHSSVMCA